MLDKRASSTTTSVESNYQSALSTLVYDKIIIFPNSLRLLSWSRHDANANGDKSPFPVL